MELLFFFFFRCFRCAVCLSKACENSNHTQKKIKLDDHEKKIFFFVLKTQISVCFLPTYILRPWFICIVQKESAFWEMRWNTWQCHDHLQTDEKKLLLWQIFADSYFAIWEPYLISNLVIFSIFDIRNMTFAGFTQKKLKKGTKENRKSSITSDARSTKKKEIPFFSLSNTLSCRLKINPLQYSRSDRKKDERILPIYVEL